MSDDKYDYEAELKAAKRAEIERLWFAEEATNEELLSFYKKEGIDLDSLHPNFKNHS